jgi:hypothetical protein
MIKTTLIIILTTLSLLGFGQNLEIININDNPNKAINPVFFENIDRGFDLKPEDYIATLKGFVVNSKESVFILFYRFWQKANELGANSFLIEKVKNNSDTIYVELSIYNIGESEMQKNYDLYPKNMVYVIGDIDKRKTTKKIKFNKEKMILAPMEFISYQNKIDEYAILGIGGFFGAKVKIKGKDSRLPEYLSLNGFGVGPGNYNQISISFNTGRIYPVDLNFGQFLIHILTEKKIPSAGVSL